MIELRAWADHFFPFPPTKRKCEEVEKTIEDDAKPSTPSGPEVRPERHPVSGGPIGRAAGNLFWLMRPPS